MSRRQILHCGKSSTTGKKGDWKEGDDKLYTCVIISA